MEEIPPSGHDMPESMLQEIEAEPEGLARESRES